jgi:hypothetical protein
MRELRGIDNERRAVEKQRKTKLPIVNFKQNTPKALKNARKFSGLQVHVARAFFVWQRLWRRFSGVRLPRLTKADMPADGTTRVCGDETGGTE